MRKKRFFTDMLISVLAISVAACGSLSKGAINGDFETVRYYVEKGDDINAIDSYGWTPLMWASYYRHVNIVNYLLEKGAKPNVQSTYAYGSLQKGSTALMIATYYGHDDIVRLLMKFRANPNLKNSEYVSAVSLAERFGHTEILAILTGKAVAKIPERAASEEVLDQTVYLHDGSKIVGRIIAQTEKIITVKTKYTTITVDKSKIKEIKYKE